MGHRTVTSLSNGSVVFGFPPAFTDARATLILGAPGAGADIHGIFLPGAMTRVLMRQGTSVRRLGSLFNSRFMSFGLIFYSSGNGPVRKRIVGHTFGGLVRRGKLPGIIFRDLQRSDVACGLGLGNNSVGSIRNSSNRTRIGVMTSICSRVVSSSHELGTREVRTTFCSNERTAPRPIRPTTARDSTSSGRLLLGLLRGPRVTTLLGSLTGAL